MNNVLQTFSTKNLQLDHDSIVKIVVNIVIFVLILAASIIILICLRKKSAGFKLLFVFYLIFWIPIYLGRDYREKMNSSIMTNLNIIGTELTVISTMVMVGYGFVGIFARVFADWFSYIFRYRKAFLYFAIIVNIATFFPIVFVQNQYSSIAQVIGVGISASCIGTVELLFRNQYDTSKSFLTVSILSIPPLLANFLTAPIQSVVSTYAKNGKTFFPDRLSILWIIGLVMLLIALVILIFIKETKLNRIKPLVNKDITKTTELKKQRTNLIAYFIVVCLIGTIVMFIKFSNSGAVALKHLKYLSNNNSNAYEGYLSVLFSLAQLVAGILMGMVLIRKWNTGYIFGLGAGVWIVYLLCAAFIKNPIVYFILHSLNGFAYGIIYNLLLALVLSISLDTVKITSMGIYQSILSIGIACSGLFSNFMKIILDPNKQHNLYDKNNVIVNMTLLGCVGFILIGFITLCLCLKKYDNNFYVKNLKRKVNETISQKENQTKIVENIEQKI